MTTFDDRESTFENKFAHDANLRFKVEARANKLLGLWAASLLDKDGDAAAAYATEVVNSDFKEPGPEDVFAKLGDDLGDKADLDMIREKHRGFLAVAETETEIVPKD